MLTLKNLTYLFNPSFFKNQGIDKTHFHKLK